MKRPHLTIMIAAAGLLAASCGASDGSADTTSTDDPGEIVIEGATSTAPAADSTTEAAEETGGADAATSQGEEELALAFAQCMRDEGIDWPDPTTAADGSIDITGGAAGPDGNSDIDPQSTEVSTAFDVCGPMIEGASFLPGDGDGFDAESQDRFLEFAQCLRDQGLDVEDPDFSELGAGGRPGGGGGGGLFGENFDPQDPANADALEACQDLFAGGPGAFGG